MPDDDEQPVDPREVADDDQLLEGFRAGTATPTADQISAYLSAWRDDTLQGLDHIYHRTRAELRATAPGYRYTDPVTDPDWPRITEPDDDDPPDVFPPGWGSGPTERDQAAIDAGNA